MTLSRYVPIQGGLNGKMTEKTSQCQEYALSVIPGGDEADDTCSR